MRRFAMFLVIWPCIIPVAIISWCVGWTFGMAYRLSLKPLKRLVHAS